MCQKILWYLVNSKKLNWFKKKKQNPYAFVLDKVDYISGAVFISIFGFLLFAEEIACPAFLLAGFAMLFFLSIVRHIKIMPADIEQAITKPLLCYQLIFSTVLLLFSLIFVMNCFIE